ncbi:sigma-70 family RNA polymerase sigma factor [Streptomyces mirabilis]
MAATTSQRTVLEQFRVGSDTIDRLRSGDREAFADLYVRYQPLVYDYLVHRTRDRDLSADLTSETFARALARIESFTWTGRDIGAWLVTIARNLVTDHFRSARTRLERPVGEIFDGEWTAGDSADEVVDHLSHAALAAAVRRILGDLTPSQGLRGLAFSGQASGRSFHAAIRNFAYSA